LCDIVRVAFTSRAGLGPARRHELRISLEQITINT
jgi:hypothetical protein